MKLNNKVVVVTGGCNGIGLSIAKLFSHHGAKVAILDKEADPIKIAFARKQLNANCIIEQGDIAKIDELVSFYDKVKTLYGCIDIVIANAAIHGKGSLENITETQFDRVVAVNLKGTYFTVTKSLPLLKIGGSILLISSVTSDFGFQEMSLYGATKASIRYLSKAFSAELASKNIRVNCISPGLINTDMPFEGYHVNDREEVMNEKIKITDEELNSIKTLQGKFQDTIDSFGRLYLEKMTIETAIKSVATKEGQLQEVWVGLQKQETEIIESLLKKYGEGNLDVSQGMFLKTV